MAALKVAEGTVPFRGYRVWYRIAGEQKDASRLPLVCLHGGPGASSEYLEPLQDIVAYGRQVIFYDQLGCGKSDQPHDPAMWTIPLYVEELGVVQRALGLGRIHLLGHSWGGVLAMEYLLANQGRQDAGATRFDGVASMILASTLASAAEWEVEAERLRAALPPEVDQVLRKHEAAGTTDSPEYEEAMLVFYQRHLCRMQPWPDCLMRAFAAIQKNPEVYNTMWGPSEFFITGTLKTWDIRPRLGELRVPTLMTSGRHDESTPAINDTLLRGIAGSRWEVFEQSGHMAHVEEPEGYNRVVEEFLREVEAAR
jgi:proline-specific peptidase